MTSESPTSDPGEHWTRRAKKHQAWLDLLARSDPPTRAWLEAEHRKQEQAASQPSQPEARPWTPEREQAFLKWLLAQGAKQPPAPKS